MALPLYLAMTREEIDSCPLPAHLAYMACHFSVYGKGLQDVPAHIPEGSMLILDDRIPVWNHDPRQVAEELLEAVTGHGCSGLLLDFQRPAEPLMTDIIRNITDTLPCPVAVTEAYAEGVSCAVLIGCPEVNEPLTKRCGPWQGREKWLELAPQTLRYTITQDRSHREVVDETIQKYPHRDAALCCSYRIEVEKDRAVFTLERTAEDLLALLRQAEELGFTRAVGLYQQLGNMAMTDDG